jgi:prepilin-type processing-associated H-X9-DG protein
MPTFKLLGADQKEYGPVSADQICQWIKQGRANARTQLQVAGSTGWKPLAEFPEFADALRATALPVGGLGAAEPKTNRLAITSLVLGCLGLLTCGITSLVGVVLGLVALVRINRSRGQLGGKGMAVAGTVVSVVVLLLALVAAAVLLPLLAKEKQKAAQKATSIRCMSNIRQLNLGLMMYVSDNNDRFPSGTNWCDALGSYVKDEKTYMCSSGTPGQRCHYAFNANLDGRELKDLQSPAQTVLAFEADGGWNAAGGSELFPVKPRHSGTHAVGFADGHAELVPAARLEKLRWEP